MGSRPVKRQPLGNYIVKICPWKNHEFRTDNPRKVYCTDAHRRTDVTARRRKREQAEREIAETLAKPWGEWRLKHRELMEAPAVRTVASTPVVKHFTKIPVRAMSGFSSIAGYNLPVLDEERCRHGVYGECSECWLG